MRTNKGAELQAKAMGQGGITPATYIGISTAPINNPPDPAHATLPGELRRAPAGFMLTVGPGYTLTADFQKVPGDPSPLNLTRIGVFDNFAGGNMWFETLLNPQPTTLVNNGDHVTITETVELKQL